MSAKSIGLTLATGVFLILSCASDGAQAADQSGLPTLNCFNSNFRKAVLKTNAAGSSLTFIDSHIQIANPDLLDVLVKTPGTASRVVGFRVVGLEPQTDRCNHLKQADYIFHCTYQFRNIELLDMSEKVIATAPSAFLEIKSNLPAVSGENDGFEVEATLTMSDKSIPTQFTQMISNTVWFNAKNGDSNARCSK
jgi:hypothetical protein